jgi:hypothetical protein
VRHSLGGRAGLRYVFQGIRIEFISHLVTVSDASLSERAAIMNKCDSLMQNWRKLHPSRSVMT